MIDFHCHILPEIDDGSRSPAESILLLQSQKEQGLTQIVCTPHFYADETTPAGFLKNRQRAYDQIARTADSMDMKLLLGAEVHYFPNVSHMDIEPLLIEGTDLLLLEMPFGKWSDAVVREVLDLQKRVQVVLAHIERYWRWQPPRSRVWKQLEEAGIFFQINCSGILNPSTSREVLKWIRQGRVTFIATDAHNMDTRPPRYLEAMEIVQKKCKMPAYLEYQRAAQQQMLVHKKSGREQKASAGGI